MKDIEPFAHGYDLTPISGRGSFRSDGSGQSQVRRPYSQLSYVGSNVFTVSDWERLKQPQSRLQVYHQTQPSYDSVDSSLRNRGPSSLATLSYGQQQQQLDLPWAGRTDDAMSELVRELPSLRPIHEPHHHQQFATLARSHPNNLNNNPLRATMPAARISAPQFITTRRALRRTPLEPVPEAIYDSSQQVPWPGLHRPENPYQNVGQMRQLHQVQSQAPPEFSTLQSHRIHRPVPILPPRIRAARPPPTEFQQQTVQTQQFQVLRPTPVDSVGQSREQHNSSGSSNEHPLEYTRDKLLGAVEKVRSGLTLRKQDLVEPFGPIPPPRKRTQLARQSTAPAIQQSSQLNYAQHGRQASYPFAYISNVPAITRAPPGNLDYDDVLLPPPAPPHRKNYLPPPPAGSGVPSMAPLRLQTYSPEQSSGISMDELSPPQSFPPPPLPSSRSYHVSSGATGSTVSHLQNIPYSRKPFDMSVDENYEFDTFFPRPVFWSQSATAPAAPPPHIPARQTRSVGPAGELGGAERWGWDEKARRENPQYRSYRLPRNIDLAQMEARCAALRQEFINFRRAHRAQLCPGGDGFDQIHHHHHQRAQQDNDDNISNSSSSSNALESIC